MKKKGFAISAMLYMILILFLALITGILANLANQKIRLEKLKSSIMTSINNKEGVDITPPVITFVGTNDLPSSAATFEIMQGIMVTDDQTPSDQIILTAIGQVSLGIPGSYQITYTAIDLSGNVGYYYRTVMVHPIEYVFTYTEKEQLFTVPLNGTYKIELWGAQGGSGKGYSGGKGGYSSGQINLRKDEKLYLHIGGMGASNDSITSTNYKGGYNGGGDSGISVYPDRWAAAGAGGGASDIRIASGLWDDELGLRARIMTAGGGGGGGWYGNTAATSTYSAGSGGVGGGLVGGKGTTSNYESGFGGTQIAGGNFGLRGPAGIFGKATNWTFADYISNGGGGYYGGGGSVHSGGGGGSSYISGHAGCIAIKSATDQTPKVNTYTQLSDSYHYSNYIFTSTAMKSGSEVMPNFDGETTMIGNSGNGYAKITYLGI